MSYQTKKWVRLYDVAEQYAVKGKVGRGTFGTVFKAISQKDNKHYALKKLENTDPKMISEGFPITALRQIALLKEIDHPNIIKLKEILLSKPSQRNMNRGSTFLVFEYMDHDLAGIVRNKIRFTLPEVKCLAKQLLEGVAYIHSQKLLHRDIKSANILLNRKGELKLGDFGLGRKFKNDGNLTYKVVTLWYRAPELILGYKKYDYKVDVWSVGCVLAQLLIGDILFRKQSDFAQLQKILEVTGDYQTNNMTEDMMKDYTTKQEMLPLKRFPRKFEQSLLALNSQLPKDAIQLLSHLLELNPEKRYTCEEALNHPFFESEPKPIQKSEIKKFEYEMKEFFKENSVKIDYEADKREDQNKKHQRHEKGADDYRHQRNDPERYYHDRKRRNDSRKRSISKEHSKNDKKNERRQAHYHKEKRKRSYDSYSSNSSNYSSPVRDRRTREKNHRRQDKHSSQQSKSHRKQHRIKDHDKRRQEKSPQSHRQYSNRYDRGENRRYERERHEKYERTEQTYKKYNKYEGEGNRNKGNYKDRDYEQTYRDRKEKEDKSSDKYRDEQRYRNTQRNQKRSYNPDEGRQRKYEKSEKYERPEKYNKYERYDRGQKGSERYEYKYKSDKEKEYSGRYDENRYKRRSGDQYDGYRGPNKYDRQRKADDQHYHNRSNDSYSRKNYGDRYRQRSREKPRERNRGQNNERQNPRNSGVHKEENFDY